jgi:hypothetical protein
MEPLDVVFQQFGVARLDLGGFTMAVSFLAACIRSLLILSLVLLGWRPQFSSARYIGVAG